MSSSATNQAAETVVVHPAGDLVAAMLLDLRTRLRQTVGAGVKHLILDFSKVYMIDSAGIGLLIAAHNSMRKSGGSLSVIHASREIVDLFRSMGLTHHLKITGDAVEGE
jgi:anti-anti-sigma factor